MVERRGNGIVASVALLALLAVRAQAGEPDSCAGFSFDVGHERALFATAPVQVTAGAKPDSAPLLGENRLYRLTLVPEDHVAFAAAPERKRGGSEADAGLARLHIAAAGTYRVALSAPFWIDVVQGGSLISSARFTGSHGCNAPHKVVEYTLAAGDYLLQISGLKSEDVEITLTSAPKPPTAH
jgi:hypothetical protein